MSSKFVGFFLNLEFVVVRNSEQHSVRTVGRVKARKQVDQGWAVAIFCFAERRAWEYMKPEQGRAGIL